MESMLGEIDLIRFAENILIEECLEQLNHLDIKILFRLFSRNRLQINDFINIVADSAKKNNRQDIIEILEMEKLIYA